MAWLIAVVAGLFETAFAVLLKQSHGITRLCPTMGAAICALVSFGLLIYALKKLEAGSACAVRTGIGAAGTAVAGMGALGGSAPALKLVSIRLILAGVIGLNLAAVTAEPATDIRGLDHAAVLVRVEAGKVNAAPPLPGRSVAQILRANVLTRFNAILGSLFAVVVVVGPPQDGLFGVVLVVNTGIGVFQELRTKRTLDKLAILTAPRRGSCVTAQPPSCPWSRWCWMMSSSCILGTRPRSTVRCCEPRGSSFDEALLSGEVEPVPKEPGGRVLSGSFVARA